MVDVQAACEYVRNIVRSMTPVRSGNLRDNGTSDTQAEVISEAFFTLNERNNAPYGIILNEAQKINYRTTWGYRERTNKHYRYFDMATGLAILDLAKKWHAEAFFT